MILAFQALLIVVFRVRRAHNVARGSQGPQRPRGSQVAQRTSSARRARRIPHITN